MQNKSKDFLPKHSLYNPNSKTREEGYFFKKAINHYLLPLIFLLSCKKEHLPFVDCNQPAKDLNVCKKLIIGKWNWKYEKLYDRETQGYIIKNSTTEGYTRMLRFLDKGYVCFYKNSNLEKELKYSISTLDVVTGIPADNSITTVIFYNTLNGSREDYVPISICTDSLFLNYNLYADTKGQQKWARN